MSFGKEVKIGLAIVGCLAVGTAAALVYRARQAGKLPDGAVVQPETQSKQAAENSPESKPDATERSSKQDANTPARASQGLDKPQLPASEPDRSPASGSESAGTSTNTNPASEKPNGRQQLSETLHRSRYAAGSDSASDSTDDTATAVPAGQQASAGDRRSGASAEAQFRSTSAEPAARYPNRFQPTTARQLVPAGDSTGAASPSGGDATQISQSAQFRSRAIVETAGTAPASQSSSGGQPQDEPTRSELEGARYALRKALPYRSIRDTQPAPNASGSQPAQRTATSNARQRPPSGYGQTGRNGSESNSTSHRFASSTSGTPLRENTGLYYVEPGDSFWTISRKVYGHGGYFKALETHNRSRFPNPRDLQVGDEVKTPSVETLLERYSGLCPKRREAKPGMQRFSTASTGVRSSGKVYVVEEGDTLFDIARYELGEARRWPEIYVLNRQTLGADIDYLRPGTQLQMPATRDGSHNPGGSGDTLTRQPGGPLRR